MCLMGGVTMVCLGDDTSGNKAEKDGETANLLANPGFEQSTDGKTPSMWMVNLMNKTDGKCVLDNTDKCEGQYSVNLSATKGEVRLLQLVACKPNSVYCLKIKVKSTPYKALIQITDWWFESGVISYEKGKVKNFTDKMTEEKVQPSSEWQEITLIHPTGPEVTHLRIDLWRGWGNTAWFDDAVLTEVKKDDSGK